MRDTEPLPVNITNPPPGSRAMLDERELIGRCHVVDRLAAPAGGDAESPSLPVPVQLVSTISAATSSAATSKPECHSLIVPCWTDGVSRASSLQGDPLTLPSYGRVSADPGADTSILLGSGEEANRGRPSRIAPPVTYGRLASGTNWVSFGPV